jgi:hypothetical protein
LGYDSRIWRHWKRIRLTKPTSWLALDLGIVTTFQINGALAVSQEFEDANTRRMGEGLEEIGLHLVDRQIYWSGPR